jgi:hypothetical protein
VLTEQIGMATVKAGIDEREVLAVIEEALA